MLRSAPVARIAAAAFVAVAITASASAAAAPAASAAIATPWPATTSASPAAPAQNALEGVWCASASDCIAVGATSAIAGRGHPLAEIWNGKSWRTVPVRLPAGSTFGGLVRLSCRSASFCVAAGEYGTGGTGHLLAEFWNGKTWSPTEPPAPAGVGDDTELVGVSCQSSRDCVAVGGDDTGATTFAVIETWNGAKWARVKPPLPRGTSYSYLEKVSCPSATYCVAVGQAGDPAKVLVESWNGAAWHVVSAPSPSGGFAELVAVSCSSVASCVAVGGVLNPGSPGTPSSTKALTETWNGKKWAIATVPWPKGTADSILAGVSCPSKTYCVAVGNVGDNLEAGQLNAGKAVAVTWNGKSWALEPVPAPAKGKTSFLFSVSCRSTASCAAVGETGSVGADTTSSLSGFWNGKTWKLVPAI